MASYWHGIYYNKSAEPMIAIMGPTGSGKSSFIKALTGSNDAIVGESLDSETDEVRVIRWVQQNGSVLNLIDTPGFDDSRDGMTDAEVLKMIAEFLVKEYRDDKKKLTGLVYVHPISDARVTGSARRNLRMFQGLCGSKALQNVVIATSKWDMINPRIGAKREEELKSKDTLFGPLIGAGAKMIRHDNSHVSAVNIINQFRNAQTIQTDIVCELEAGKTLAQTSAADALQEEIKALMKKHEQDRLAAEKEMQDAIKAKDTQLQRVLEEERKAREADKAKLEMKQDVLNSQIQALSRRNEEMQANLRAKENEARIEREKAAAELRRIREEDRKAREADKAEQRKLMEAKEEKMRLERAELQRVREEEEKRRASESDRKKVNSPGDTQRYRFTFVGRNGFYASYGGKSVRANCPSALENILYKEQPSDILSISVGLNGDFFLRTKSLVYGCGLPSNLELDQVTQFAFGPNGGWCALLEGGGYSSSNIPSSLLAKIRSVLASGVTSISLGPNNSWAITYGDSGWSTSGVDPKLNETLHSAANVKGIILNSQAIDDWFFECDGGNCRRLNRAWNEAVGRLGD